MALTRIRVLNQQSTYNVDRLNANTLVVGGNNITGASGAGGGIVISSVVYLAANGTPLIANAAPTSGNSVIKIVGSGFAANANVFLNGLLQPSANVTFVDSTELRLNMPPLASNTYSLFTFNSASAGAIFYSGVRFDPYPIWTTGEYTAIGYVSTQLLVTGYGSGSISFSVASGNTITSGLTLSANGLITGTAAEGTYNFYVDATDSENEITTQQISLTVVFPDTYFPYTTLLLSASSQTANNVSTETFIDSSNSNLSITATGTPYQGTFSPFPTTGTWSNYFNGVTGYLTTPSSSAFALGSSNFTIEFWMNISSFPDNSSRIYANATGADWAANKWTLHCNHPANVGKLSFWDYNYNSSSMLLTGSTTLSFNTWYHVAIVRNSNSFAMYLNGALEATNTYSGSMDSGATISQIGGNVTAELYHGYISNFRVINGTAQYTSAFTPPTTPLTAITNTSLLTCQSHRFIDNSTNAFTITPTGAVDIQRFNPFGNSLTSYSPSTNGGSIYFNGSAYLTSTQPVAFGIGDFTIELWFYDILASAGFYPNLISTVLDYTTAGGIRIGFGPNTRILSVAVASSAVISTTVTYAYGTWNHVALTRIGTTLTLYLNGINVGSSAGFSTNLTTNSIVLGNVTGGGIDYYFTGYMSNVRIIRGTGIYTGNFTPSTTPPTVITNTQYLLLGTNSKFLDSTKINNIRNVGGVATRTDVKNYGTNSWYFNGSSYLTSISNPTFAFGSGNFTVEGWINPTSLPTYCTICSTRTASGTTAGWNIGVSPSGELFLYANGFMVTGASSGVLVNTWTHFAIVRSGTSLKAYVNGIQSGSTTSDSNNYTIQTFWIGITGGSAEPWYGYIQDFRITKSIARYTTTFTPPTTPFQLY